MKKKASDFNWEWAKMTKPDNSQIRDGDIREVTLPVQVAMRWSTMIPKEIDEDGTVTEYTSGFIMDVLPQKFLYNGQETKFLYDEYKGK